MNCRNADMQLLSKIPFEKFRTADKNQDCGYADMRLRSNIYVKFYVKRCGVEVVDGWKNCGCEYAEMQFRTNISWQSCGYAVAEMLLQVAKVRLRQKKCTCPPILGFIVQAT
jgi:hypothetical protein